MDAEDSGGLGLVVAGGGQHVLDVVVFEFAQGDEVAAIGRELRFMVRGTIFVSIFAGVVANFFRQRGRVNVAFDDVRRVALPALRHRLILNYDAEAKGMTADRVVGELLAAVPEGD